jgi:putative tricarboxylic transport membrane protein
MYRRVELALTVSCLLLGIGVVIGAGFITRLQPPFEDPIGARGFAYAVGTFTAACAAVLLVVQVNALRVGRTSFADEGDPEITGDDPRYPASSRQAFLVIGIMAAYAVLLTSIGYLLATAVFITAGMWGMGSRGLVRLATFPIGFAIVSYVVFDTLLGVRLPPGVLGPLLEIVGLE